MRKSRPDWLVVGLVWGLTLFGLLMVGNVSVVEAYRGFGSAWHFFRLQLGWIMIGLVAFIFLARVRLSWLGEIAPVFLGVNLIFLLLVLLPGLSQPILGARRWLNFGWLNFQPAELAKLSVTLYLSTYLAKGKDWWRAGGVVMLILFLVALEPDLGTMLIIFFLALAIYFVSGPPLLYPSLFLALVGIVSIFLVLISPYRRERALTFFNPERDPLGSSYQVKQALIALGSGGLWGVGLGQSRQKYAYLPETTTDSIFAIIAEETGFFGSLAVVMAYFLLFWRGLRIAKKVQNLQEKLLATGVTAWLGGQTIINLGAMTALIPLTGVPLPFISYGGSSLVLNLAAAGLLVNLSRFLHKT